MEFPMFYDLTDKKLFKNKWHIGTEENPFVSLCGRADSGGGLPIRYNKDNQTTTLCPICAHRLITKQATENEALHARVAELELENKILRAQKDEAEQIAQDYANGTIEVVQNNGD